MGIAPCARYGTHRMRAQGFAVAYDNVTKKTNNDLGSWFKCDCGERVITEGYPDSQRPWPIYHYVTEGAIKGTAMIGGQYGFYIDSSLIRYTEELTIPGYNFNY
jgi:hypothetical protein